MFFLKNVTIHVLMTKSNSSNRMGDGKLRTGNDPRTPARAERYQRHKNSYGIVEQNRFDGGMSAEIYQRNREFMRNRRTASL